MTNACRRAGRRPGPAACRGAMLLLVMFIVALVGVMLTVAGRSWHMAARRDKEAQLLFVGGEYSRAFARYRAATPPGLPDLPEKLLDLILDERQSVPARHLRRLYRDPLTNGAEWGLVKEGGRIGGVYSLDKGVPIKTSGFAEDQADFAGAKTYGDWRFVAVVLKGKPADPPQPAAANADTNADTDADADADVGSPQTPTGSQSPPVRRPTASASIVSGSVRR